jgi:hypothetical protein
MTPADLARRIELNMPAAFENFATNSAATRICTALTSFGEFGHELGFMPIRCLELYEERERQ